MASQNCNLECVKTYKSGDEVVEFVGPVKIVMVDQPKSVYSRKVWHAALISLGQMLLAVTSAITIFYSMSYNKSDYMKGLHIFLSTAGLQLIILSGILSMNRQSGASASMKLADKRWEHVYLQFFGLAFSAGGAAISWFSRFSPMFTVHSILGFVAEVALLLAGLCGISFYLSGKPTTQLGSCGECVYAVHRILGISGAFLSSSCFLSGIIKKIFIEWLPIYYMFHCLVGFCIFYTLAIVYKPLKKLMK